VSGLNAPATAVRMSAATATSGTARSSRFMLSPFRIEKRILRPRSKTRLLLLACGLPVNAPTFAAWRSPPPTSSG
jgi:hypothetical protein